MKRSTNITWHQPTITRKDRNLRNGHQSCILWFTGLSGSGKSTIANEVELKLFDLNVHSYLLDGDNIRHGLNRDLGFSNEDRQENIRRIAETTKLFIDSGQFALTAFISPFRKDRDAARELVAEDDFIEVFVKCPLEVCEKRDPKRLYKKARKGEIPSFTGISSPYEEPLQPEITIESDKYSVAECANIIIDYLIKQKKI